MAVDPEFLSELIGLVYDVGLGQASWGEFAQSLNRVCPTGRVSMFIHGRSHGCDDIVAESGWSADDLAVYRQHYAAINPFLAYARSVPVGIPLQGTTLLRDSGTILEETEYFQDYLKPRHRGWQGVAVVLERTERTYSGLGLSHGIDNQDELDDQKELFRLLVPHIRRALDKGRQLSHHGGMAASEPLAALDLLNTAILLLNAEGQVQWSNRLATALARNGDGFGLDKEGRPRGIDAAVTARLRTLTQRTGLHALSAGGTVVLPRDGGQAPLTATVTRLAPTLTPAMTLGAGGMMMLVTDPDRTRRTSLDWMAQHFGLTPAERRLTEALVSTLRLDAAADHLGITIGTARTRLKQIMAKTDCRRQAELIQLAQSAPGSMIVGL